MNLRQFDFIIIQSYLKKANKKLFEGKKVQKFIFEGKRAQKCIKTLFKSDWHLDYINESKEE